MILGVSNHFSERIWGFSIKSYDSNSFPLTELKIRKSDCLICHSSKPVHCHPQSELCPEQSRRAVCLRLLRCFDPGAATCPPSPPAERGADRPLCWQLQPQEISPPPTANLDRSSDRVYEHVTGLVKAVIEMSSKIQPAPPEEYVPMVKVSRPRRAPAARVPSPGEAAGPRGRAWRSGVSVRGQRGDRLPPPPKSHESPAPPASGWACPQRQGL